MFVEDCLRPEGEAFANFEPRLWAAALNDHRAGDYSAGHDRKRFSVQLQLAPLSRFANGSKLGDTVILIVFRPGINCKLAILGTPMAQYKFQNYFDLSEVSG